jgi:hypothetical protein
MVLQEYEEALANGYTFLDNHNQLLHSLKLSRLNADNHTYTENTQAVGNDTLEPGQGIGQPGDGLPT